MLDHGILNLPLNSRARGGSIDRQLDKYKAEQSRIKAAADREQRQTTHDAKKAARLLKEYIPIIAAKMASKENAKFSKKEIAATLDSWMKWQPAKYIQIVTKYQRENV